MDLKVSNLISYALIMFGWIVVHFLSARRDKHKEKRQLGNAILDSLENLQTNAYLYHTSLERLDANERQIRMLIDKIDNHLNRLMPLTLYQRFLNKINPKDAPENLIINIRSSVTENNFATLKFEKQNDNSDIIRGFNKAIRDASAVISKRIN